jgi:hypothetical protein
VEPSPTEKSTSTPSSTSTNEEQVKEVRSFEPFVEAIVGPTITDSSPTTNQEEENEVEDFKQLGGNNAIHILSSFSYFFFKLNPCLIKLKKKI